MRAVCTIICVLALAAPAHAADTLRVGIRSNIDAVVPGPDGGAWIGVRAYPRARVVRVAPDGRLRPTPVDYLSLGAGAVLGPDARAWFLGGNQITRVDAAGSVTTIATDSSYDGQLANGADGTVWLSGRQPRRVTVDGTVTPAPLTVRGCKDLRTHALTQATDGAMWFSDVLCGLVRVPPDGTPAVVAQPMLNVGKLVPDQHGGIWFSADDGPGGGHVDASGRITPLKRERRSGTYDVAVGPDGHAYFTTGKCFLDRAQPDGSVTRVPTALPTWHVGFDPVGGLWLASAARVQHTTLGASPVGCDDEPPAVRIVPDPSKPIDLATLRRQRGFKLTVREPFGIEGHLIDSDADDSIGDLDQAVTRRGGRTLRWPMSARAIRRVGRRTGSPIVLDAGLRDREGNYRSVTYELRVRR